MFKVFYATFYFFRVDLLTIFNINVLFNLVGLDRVLFCKSDYNYVQELQCLDRLFFKVEQLRLESNLSFFFARNFNLKLQNIFNFPLYFDFVQLFSGVKLIAQSKLTTLEFMLYLSCKLRISGIFARFLAKNLEIESRHRKILWSVVNAVNSLSRSLPLFKGIRIYITGKLNGKMRRKTYSFKFGCVALQRISSNLDYFKSTSFTKFGTISVKV